MKTLFTLLLSVGLLISHINATTIYSYTTATNGNYNSIASNTTATALSVVNTAALASGAAICPTGFSVRNFSSATVFSTSLDAVEFTITPDVGYRVSIDAISAGLRRSNSGPASVRYACRIGSGAFIDKGSDDSPNNAGCGSTASTSWSGLGINSSETVTFRFYGFNAGAGTGTLQIIDLLVTGSGVLPVELTHFETKATPQSIVLSWKTAYEKDNDYFNIEHSTTGFDFKSIHQMKGNGSTVVGATYTYEHTTPSVKNNYYRLKQVDFDGKYAYSSIKHISFNKKKWLIVSNVVHDFLNVETNGERSSGYIIINLVGNIVLKGNLNASEKIDISQLANGVYIFQTEYGEFERFVKN